MQLHSKLLVTILLFTFTVSSTFSQNDYNFKQFLNETGDYYTAPLHWEANDFLTLGIIAASTVGLMYADEPIKKEITKINSDRQYWLIEVGRYWGEPIPSLALTGLLLIHGYSFDNTTTKKIGFEIGQSFLYSVSVTSSLKIIIGRARPYTGNDPFTFNSFSFSNPSWSLPSGHTTVAFSLSTVLAANTDNTALRVAAFVPAFLTAISRVYQNHHWTSDVFLGAIIGYFTGKFVTDFHKGKETIGEIQTTPLLSISLSM